MIKYDDLKKTSRERYVNEYEKIIKSNFNIDDIKKMSRIEYNRNFGTHIKRSKKDATYKGRLSLINQIARKADNVLEDYAEKEEIYNEDWITFFKQQNVKKLHFKRKVIIEQGKGDKIEEIPIPRRKKKYGIVKIQDDKNNQDYFIKYKDENSLIEQLQTLKDSKQFDDQDFTWYFGGFHFTEDVLTEEFKKEMEGEEVFF